MGCTIGSPAAGPETLPTGDAGPATNGETVVFPAAYVPSPVNRFTFLLAPNAPLY